MILMMVSRPFKMKLHDDIMKQTFFFWHIDDIRWFVRVFLP